MAASRWCYNQTIEHLTKIEGPRPHWTLVKKHIVSTCLEWMKQVPFQVKAVAVKDACEVMSREKLKCKTTGRQFKMRFRSRRLPTQSCFIPGPAIKPGDGNIGLYVRIAGSVRAAETLPHQHRDSRLVWDNGAWFLAVSFRAAAHTTGENQARAVALDPGVRTFLTFFSPTSYGKLGDQAQQRIVRLLVHLDRLISERAKSNSRRKRRLTLAIGRMRRKLRSLIDELHWKSIRFLLDNFDIIIVPPFAAGQMVRKTSRKLRNKSVRAMLGLSHSKFRARLISKAKYEGKQVILQCEAYTSKTVSWAGELLTKLGGRKYVRSADGVTMDRDVNGARGTFLRALVDTPLTLA